MLRKEGLVADPGTIRTVFIGTSRFAVPSLWKLARSGYDLVAVVSQPARPAGRGRKTTPSPVARTAETLKLLTLTPQRIKSPESLARLEALRPDLLVVAAYAQILPKVLLDLPPRGCLNVHASLLPRWRGASPIQSAILAGDQFTGVSIMAMEPAMDTGPVLSRSFTRIVDADALPELEDRLARAGAALLASTIPCYLSGTARPVAQDGSHATYAPIITKRQGLIDWTRPAVEIWRANRAYRPWPGTFTYWREKLLKVVACRPADVPGEPGPAGTVDRPGPARELGVWSGDGFLLLDEVAPEGGRAMTGREFLAGHPDFAGSRLG